MKEEKEWATRSTDLLIGKLLTAHGFQFVDGIMVKAADVAI